jgi:hypothetical protein
MENQSTIQELIEEYNFSALTPDQKAMVLTEISEKEYNKLRETITLTNNYFDNEPSLMVDDALKPKIERRSVLLRIVNYKISLYKIAAAVVIIVLSNYLITNSIGNDTTEFVEETVDSIGDKSVEDFDELMKFTSHNSIKYNKGLAQL